jgi:hypothetical protein
MKNTLTLTIGIKKIGTFENEKTLETKGRRNSVCDLPLLISFHFFVGLFF